ncbi:MAG: hypothetical protein A2046_15130 [Bacteroidetes bacterium GWA2_30_7]|nr:MAG: hypothetical protein A2046_15130 [Bacteroidetes bacterium GWA2_30_7]
MKKLKYLILGLLFINLIYSFKPSYDGEKDWNSCVEKYKATWGDVCMECTYNYDIFKVFMKNVCTENVDVLVAVQESNKVWKCFMFENLAPNDTIVAHACKGTGKYLKWVRKAGDREIELPNCDEVNKNYK